VRGGTLVYPLGICWITRSGCCVQTECGFAKTVSK